MKIWVDADACPRDIRTIVIKAARRLQVPVCFVSNHPIALPNDPLVSRILVPVKADEADHTIAAQVESDDIVITADVPFAAEVVEKGADAIDPRGEHYSEEDVRTRLSTRNFMEEMRSAGYISGGPKSFGSVEKQKFAATFDRILTRRVRQRDRK